PTKVALGFAKAKGVTVAELEELETPKGIYLGIRKIIKGIPAEKVLSDILPQLVLDMPFPKFMRWGSSTIRFARPIHWIVALLGNQVIKFELEGLESGRISRGHRFMAPQGIEISQAEDYVRLLREGSVIVDPEERDGLLRQGIDSLSQKTGGRVVADEELIQEINFLVELPEPVSGSFSPEFLKLPPEVLVTSMKEHQRYFPLWDGEGRLLPRFIAVNNTRVKDIGRVVKGHEKVLRARLSDAQFFFREDLKEPLNDKTKALKGVVFHSKLGTSYEKVERIVALAGYLAQKLAPAKKDSVQRCAWLCKADLTSLMVGEFPTLQGVMGKEYALKSNELKDVAQGIYEHYLPLSAGGALPQTEEGALVSLADRLDTLAGFFGIGQIPSGSADPYALRRHAQAVVLLIWHKQYALSLDQLFDEALNGYVEKFKADSDSVKNSLNTFFSLRLQHLLEGEGLERETIDAVLSVPWDDIVQVRLRAKALGEFQSHPDFHSLAIGCKRALNILKGIEASSVVPVNPLLLSEEQEKSLYDNVLEKEGRLEQLLKAEDYSGYLVLLAQLRPAIDAFFDKVLVMAKEENIKQNRLALLFKLTSLFKRFALFSKFSI
ncbi:MAG TPA: glycine--tRNA ligase subunit beta, partial [Thermodesulfobacteriota bacterium]|nr:glycine--tRNA ligase subunit beta [Thermodesulfobacteriota bacterium]